jgi:hypothetical protein
MPLPPKILSYPPESPSTHTCISILCAGSLFFQSYSFGNLKLKLLKCDDLKNSYILYLPGIITDTAFIASDISGF